jgi:hypothetical protein
MAKAVTAPRPAEHVRITAGTATLGGDLVKLEIVPGASRLFEQPGTLEAVARLARAWFQRWLGPAA